MRNISLCDGSQKVRSSEPLKLNRRLILLSAGDGVYAEIDYSRSLISLVDLKTNTTRDLVNLNDIRTVGHVQICDEAPLTSNLRLLEGCYQLLSGNCPRTCNSSSSKRTIGRLDTLLLCYQSRNLPSIISNGDIPPSETIIFIT